MASAPRKKLDLQKASRLIPSEKQPHCTPFGIGEALGRIIGKVSFQVTEEDTREASENLRVCAGHHASIRCRT